MSAAPADEFVLDTPTVRAFIAGVRSAIAGAASPGAACDAIRPAFSRLLADPDWLAPEYARDAPESGMGGGIGQWLLFRAGDRSLTLFSLVVPAGSQTPVHDHLAWGLVGLYRGTQDEEIYARRAAALTLRERRALEAGRLLRAPPAARRHPPRADDVRRDVGLDPPAHERHGLRVAPRLRARVGGGAPVPVGVRQRGVRGGGVTKRPEQARRSGVRRAADRSHEIPQVDEVLAHRALGRGRLASGSARDEPGPGVPFGTWRTSHRIAAACAWRHPALTASPTVRSTFVPCTAIRAMPVHPGGGCGWSVDSAMMQQPSPSNFGPLSLSVTWKRPVGVGEIGAPTATR